MTSIPSNIARVPNLLTSQLMLGSISRANQDLFRAQVQMSSGLRINRPSDDPIGTSTVSVLDDIIERRDQHLRNLSHADSVLGNVDAALGDISNLLIEAKGVAASQIGIGSDSQTRDNQAKVIDALLNEAVLIANRKYQELHLFAGTATARTPIVELHQGLQYQGEGDGLTTDLGLTRKLPITVSGVQAFGAVSSRVQGERDLDPIVLPATRLADLNGARGLGVSLASVEVDVGGTDITVDLTTAHTVQDVADLLEADIQLVDPAAVVRIDPVTQNRFEVIPGAAAITISDPATDATAADLGLNMTFPLGGATGGDLDPRIVPETRLDSLAGVTFPLGTIKLSNVGQTRDLDLSSAVTVEDLVNLVEGIDLGIRVEIAESGDRFDFVNELSGGAMSVGETAGGVTATELGVRSLTGNTELADFNDGLGVDIKSGAVDPITGLPDPARDIDFRIDLKDGVTQLDIDLVGAVTVQ
ncbi:MAG: hypothetical protein KJO43_02280, partial [Phycisphaerae bacterium]|nr:hypothetical protein [Phycisphaerae bacterium]